MIRRACILFVLFALVTLSAAPAAFADEPAPGTSDSIVAQIVDWLAGVLGNEDSTADDEFTPQFLPGG